MPDWLPGVIVAAIAAIPILWATIQQRRKINAETDKVSAETDGALVIAYKSLVSDLRERLDVALTGNRLKDEENRGLRETNALLYEQKMHAQGIVTALTARLAMLEGKPLYNANDLDERGQDNGDR